MLIVFCCMITILLFFRDLFWFLHDLTRLLQRIESIAIFLLIGFFCFLSNQDNLYMNHKNSDLFYDIYNTINAHNWRQTYYFSKKFPNYLLKNDLKMFLVIFPTLSLILIFLLINFQMHYMLFIIVFGRNKSKRIIFAKIICDIF